MKKPILIVTFGNPDAGDDGFGDAVAEVLRSEPVPGITVAKLGIRTAGLLDHVQGHAALIIVDAVCCPDEKPGILIDMDWFDAARPTLKSEEVLSTHGISIGQQIALAQSLDMLPSVVRLVGVNIVQAQIGSLMTKAVQSCVLRAVSAVKQHAVRTKSTIPSAGDRPHDARKVPK